MNDDGAKVISLAQRRRDRRVRRIATIDVNTFRVQAMGDGSLVLRGEAYSGKSWRDFTWTIPPEMAKDLAGQIQGHHAYNEHLARYAESLAAVRLVTEPAAEKRKRCKLTPEGWTGGRRACARWRGHKGPHRDTRGHTFEIRAETPSEVSRS